MIDVVVSFLLDFVDVLYVPHMFVAVAVLGLVNIILRFFKFNF